MSPKGNNSNDNIPIMNGPADVMTVGPNGANLASTAIRRHPVDRMQRASASNKGLDLDAVRHIYGSGLAMRLATERHLASQVGGRLMAGHVGSSFTESHAMLDTLTGDDMNIDFGDVLNRPCDSVGSHVGRVDPHSYMEKKLNL